MVDFHKLLARKRQQLESIESQIGVLREEVGTLERALAIAEREEGMAAEGKAAQGAPQLTFAMPPVSRPERSVGRLSGLIREIVGELDEPFSTVAVRNQIMERDPELYEATHYSSISGTMRRMIGKGLVQVEKGGPGKEATYRRQRPGEFHALKVDEFAEEGGESDAEEG